MYKQPNADDKNAELIAGFRFIKLAGLYLER